MDILLDGTKAATLSYGEYTPYVRVPSGGHKVTIKTISGTTVVERPLFLSPKNIDELPQTYRTIVAVGSVSQGTIDIAPYNDGDEALGQLKFRIANLF